MPPTPSTSPLRTRWPETTAAIALLLAGFAASYPFRPVPSIAQPGGSPSRPIIAPMPEDPHWTPPGRIAPSPIITRNLTLMKYSAAVAITDGTATTRVTLDFRNDTPNTLEGDFVFPVPKGAIVSDFALRDGDKRMNPELLDADTARQWYLDIVRQAIDPGLLEYVDQSAYRVRAFPFTAGQTRSLEISFTHQLPSRGNLRTYSLPLQFAAPNINLIRNLQMLGPNNATGMPIREDERIWQPEPMPVAPTFVATVDIAENTGLGAITCTSHNLSIAREGVNTAHGSVESTITPSTGEFELLIGRSTDEFAASMIAYPGENGEDGYFTLTLYPTTRGMAKSLPKNVVLVLDTSGSMEGEKWEQARGALKYVVDHLGSSDRLALVDYDDLVNEAWSGFQLASAPTRNTASTYLASLTADGGTNIHDALQRGSRIVASNSNGETPDYMLFFTDGLATVGNTDPASIMNVVKSTLPVSARLFTFGVGYDVNTQLLDSLARDHRGASDYVEPNQNIESVVSAFYQKIQNPALTDVKLNWGGMQVYDVLPGQMTDLFHGTQLTIAGRYRGTPPSNLALTLTGRAGSQQKTIPLTVNGTPTREATFVPRLWANYRVATLLQQLQVNPSNAELLDQVRKLAQRYGIVTPYTSYLVREDMRFASAEQELSLRERAAPGDVMGYGAVQKSKSLNARGQAAQSGGAGGGNYNVMADSEVAEEDRDAYNEAKAMPAAPADAPAAAANALPTQFMNQIGNVTYLAAGIGMVDSRYDPSTKATRVVQIAAFSDRYFALLEAVPALGSALSQGAEVTVMVSPGLALQTVLLDDQQQPVSTSQVNALRSQSNDVSPAGYRAASEAEWKDLLTALGTGYFEG